MSAQSKKIIRTFVIRPTANTSAYADGDALHTDPIELEGAVQKHNGSGSVIDVSVLDVDGIGAALSILFFSEDPADSTITINDAVAIHANDRAKLLGKVDIAAASYSAVGSAELGRVQQVLSVETPKVDGSVLRPSSLFVVVVVNGTPTFTSTTPLEIKIGIEQD